MRCISVVRPFSVCRAKNLVICLVFLEPRPSKLAPVRDGYAVAGSNSAGQWTATDANWCLTWRLMRL
jgi:hypothetical protein